MSKVDVLLGQFIDKISPEEQTTVAERQRAEMREKDAHIRALVAFAAPELMSDGIPNTHFATPGIVIGEREDTRYGHISLCTTISFDSGFTYDLATRTRTPIDLAERFRYLDAYLIMQKPPIGVVIRPIKGRSELGAHVFRGNGIDSARLHRVDPSSLPARVDTSKKTLEIAHGIATAVNVRR